MDRKICSLFVMTFFIIVLINIADGAGGPPVKSVFIFNHYKKIEEVKNYRFLKTVYVHDLPPADMMKVCTNIARSTYFQMNGYRLIRGGSADGLRNYKISRTRLGKRELIVAFKCPMDPPVYVQHTGKMIMVYLKKPKNVGCSDENEERSSSSGRSWFRNFFRRVKRFLGVKPYHRVGGANDFLCLGEGVGVANPTALGEDGTTTVTSDVRKHTLEPAALPRVKFGGNIFYGVSSIDDLVGFGGIRIGSRFRGKIRPVDREENYLGETSSATVVSENDIQAAAVAVDSETDAETDLQTAPFNSKLWFDNEELAIQSKTRPTLVVDQGEENTDFKSHILSDVNVQSEVHSSDVDSRINFSESDLKPLINSSADGSSPGSSVDYANSDLRPQKAVLEVDIQPKLDTADRIHSTESEFGSISSLPLGRL